jgi:hypothetical protein
MSMAFAAWGRGYHPSAPLRAGSFATDAKDGAPILLLVRAVEVEVTALSRDTKRVGCSTHKRGHGVAVTPSQLGSFLPWGGGDGKGNLG